MKVICLLCALQLIQQLYCLSLIQKQQRTACIPFHIWLLNYETLFRTHLELLLLRTGLNDYNTTLFSSIAACL